MHRSGPWSDVENASTCGQLRGILALARADARDLFLTLRFLKEESMQRTTGHILNTEWFIELINPEEREFGSNLRPVSYRSRQLPGGWRVVRSLRSPDKLVTDVRLLTGVEC